MYKSLREVNKGKSESQVILTTTLINTKREISLPLFLVLKYPKQLRTNEEIGKGGSAIVYKGELLDANLKKQHNIENVAVKFVQGTLFLFSFLVSLFSFLYCLFSFYFPYKKQKKKKDIPSMDYSENEVLFNSEIAVMWSLNNRPNVIKLIGFCQKVLFFLSFPFPFPFPFSFFFSFFVILLF